MAVTAEQAQAELRRRAQAELQRRSAQQQLPPLRPEDLAAGSGQERPVDPAGPPLDSGQKTLVSGAREAAAGTRGALASGLGVIAWPFERTGNITSAVPMGLTEPADDAYGKIVNVEKRLRAAGKALNPWSEPSEDLTVWPQFWDLYYRRVAREEPPQWYTVTSSISSEFLTEGLALGAAGKGAKAMAKAMGINKKLEAMHPTAWKLTKLETRANKAKGVEKALELAQPTRAKELKPLAKTLSERLGRPVSTTAVQRRLSQIIKGSVTTNDDLAKIANPIIREFELTRRQLQQLGVMGSTYVEPLSKAQRAAQTGKLSQAQKQLKRLQTAPHYVGTPEISGRFPGRAKQIQSLQEKIGDLQRGLQMDDLARGGTKYFPRLYESVEAKRQVGGPAASYGRHRIKRGFAKHRQDIPDEVRRLMGEMDTPTYPVAKRLIEESAAVENAAMFQKAAQNPALASRVPRKGLASKAIPDDKAYGALRGMYVHPRVRGDVTELVRMKEWWEAAYDSFIGNWKAFKVTWSPATHGRNLISNSILTDMGGMGHGAQAKYVPRAIKDMAKGADEWKDVRRYFGGSTLMHGELMDDLMRAHKSARGEGFARSLDKANRVSQKIHKYPAEIYQHEELLGKYSRYLWNRDRGLSKMDSIMDANKWLIDYSDLSQFEKRVMRRVMPFYTFPRKAIPLVAEAVATNPFGVAKYPAFFKTATQASLAALNMNDADYEQIRKDAPEYVQDGSYLLLPYRDVNNDLRLLDMSYIVPWGVLGEVASQDPLKVLVTNPLIQIVGDLHPQRNKSSFTGRSIWDEEPTDSKQEQFAKKVLYVWQALAPSLAPKGLYWDKLYDAFTGVGTGYDQKGEIKKRPIPETLAHTLVGLRTQPVDPNMNRMYGAMNTEARARDAMGRAIRLQKDLQRGAITQEEHDKQIKALTERIQKSIKEKL